MRLNGEEVRYPAFLLGRPDTKPLAFTGPRALFISGRFRPPLGAMKEDVLLDSSGRTWTLSQITKIGRWGSWVERASLWWKREYLVEYEASEGPLMSLDELKSWLLHKTDESEAALRADADASDQVRQFFLESWSEFRKELVAAETFAAVARAMGPWGLRRDHWFTWQGRSNRAEYLAVFLFVVLFTIVLGLVASIMTDPIRFLIGSVIGTIVPLLLIGAILARRAHDLGWSIFVLYLVGAGLGFVEEGIQRFAGDAYVWFAMAVPAVFFLAMGLLPGTPDENRYGPRPNPGPSL